MSSLSEIKKEIESLEDVLVTEVTALVDLEDQVAAKAARVETYRKQKDRLTRALAILEGAEIQSVGADGNNNHAAVATIADPPADTSTKRKAGRPKGSKNKTKLNPDPTAELLSEDRPFIRKVPKVDPSMVCPSCNGTLENAFRTLPNGKVIGLKVCGDCNNEVFG